MIPRYYYLYLDVLYTTLVRQYTSNVKLGVNTVYGSGHIIGWSLHTKQDRALL